MSKIAKPRIKRLIWDIETSPNIGFFWRSGYRLSIQPENILSERAIICICYKWEGQKKVHSLEWNRGDDKQLLQTFMEVANQADELVAHNGDKFDLKWFNARCLYHRLEPPPIWKTVDTLVVARRRFYLNSNRLDYLGKLLFGAGKADTGGFQTWKDICIENCPKAMKRMVKYCKEDVRLLERVWQRLEPYHRPKTHVGVLNGGEKWTCPYTGSQDVIKSKTIVSTAGTTSHQMKNKETGKYFTINDKTYRDYLEWTYDNRNHHGGK